MAHIPNLKQHILDIAKALASKYGISKINVRMVAKESGVAIGTIYNYYPAKGDIIAAVIADFWKAAFANISPDIFHKVDLISALEQVYYELLKYVSSFKDNWLEQLMLLNAKDKDIGRAMEKEYMQKIYSAILALLEHNAHVLEHYTHQEREGLARFIYDNILLMLKRNEQDFSLFKKILQRIID